MRIAFLDPLSAVQQHVSALRFPMGGKLRTRQLPRCACGGVRDVPLLFRITSLCAPQTQATGTTLSPFSQVSSCFVPGGSQTPLALAALLPRP
jgi:hypothetical protein